MQANSATTLYPCPFSQGYGLPTNQAWDLLRIYYIYRFILACSITILFYFRFEPLTVGSTDNLLYRNTSLVYLVLTVCLGFAVLWRSVSYSALAQVLILSDIFLLALLMFASGGVKSGVGILIAVSVAASGLLIGGRCALVLAAIASLVVLGEEIYAIEYLRSPITNYTYAGMLGASYFAIALLSVVLARRSEQIMQLADRQQHTIIQLEELNQYIVRHLQSGIIIADSQQVVHVANHSALRLADLTLIPHRLKGISEKLSEAFENWLLFGDNNVAMLKFAAQTEIQCRFVALPTHKDDFYMILLEDVALYNQRLQQSKLASLGRLTASIAHEIRNPLGAISHAGQLLSESPHLASQDLRLTKIIETNSSRVNQIINDILNLSKRTDSVREKINLQQWLVEYLTNYYLEHSEANQKFKLWMEDPTLANNELKGFIDPGHLKQIMDNLCQNALRYGHPELGPISIRIKKTLHGPCVEVIDNGSGISLEHQQQLFEPFFTSSASGTGLGLFISRELAELNQAKLSYYLTDNNRSCFGMCLQDANIDTIEV